MNTIETWWTSPNPGGPPVGPPFIRALYPPDAVFFDKTPSEPGKDVEAIKRAVARSGHWSWQTFDRNFSNAFSHGLSGNVSENGLAGLQRQNGIDATGWMGKKAYDLIRYALIPDGLPNAGEHLLDATAVWLLNEFAQEHGGSDPGGVQEPRIYSCFEWGARPCKGLILAAGQPVRTIFHHTAGHHPEISGPSDESLEEAFRYARDIQRFHMDVKDWMDSGHNFLVCLNGTILEGRHGSLGAIRQGQMIVSAHCPGQNTQPGIEHEHLTEPAMSAAQFAATTQLHAWIAEMCNITTDNVAHGHREFYATSCPAELFDELQPLRRAVAQLRD